MSREIVISLRRSISSWLLPWVARTEKLCFVRDVLHDRAAVGAGQPDGVRDDGLEHLVEVEAGADDLADLAQRLELDDLGGELTAARLEGPQQLDLAERDGALDAELVEPAELVLVERRDVHPPHREHPDDLVAQHHRRRQQGAVAADPLQVEALVLRVREHVRDLLRTTVDGDPPDQRHAVPGHGVAADVAAELLGDLAGHPGQPDAVPVDQVELTGVGVAQASGALDDRVEDGVRVRVDPPESEQDLAARHRLLDRVAELAVLVGGARVTRVAPMLLVHGPTSVG